MNEKLILDCCCGSRMFWFDKQNPNVVFMDCRELNTKFGDGRSIEVKPDIVGDFRKIPFPDNHFNLVVFDPPHREDLTEGNWMHLTYGRLLPTWKDDIQLGFNECMRVLKPAGTLIFKWNENKISTKKILKVINHQPLFGHPTTRNGMTQWMAFMKGI